MIMIMIMLSLINHYFGFKVDAVKSANAIFTHHEHVVSRGVSDTRSFYWLITTCDVYANPRMVLRDF